MHSRRGSQPHTSMHMVTLIQAHAGSLQRCATLEGRTRTHTAPPMTSLYSDGNAQSRPHTNSTHSHTHTCLMLTVARGKTDLHTLSQCPLWPRRIAGGNCSGGPVCSVTVVSEEGVIGHNLWGLGPWEHFSFPPQRQHRAFPRPSSLGQEAAQLWALLFFLSRAQFDGRRGGWCRLQLKGPSGAHAQ